MPQHHSVPSAMPQLRLFATISVCHVAVLATGVGTRLFVFVPSPSVPEPLSPQQYAAPASTPQLWPFATDALCQSLLVPIKVGNSRTTVVPSPTWPLKL